MLLLQNKNLIPYLLSSFSHHNLLGSKSVLSLCRLFIIIVTGTGILILLIIHLICVT
jgi:hypothetical protein